MKQSSQTATNLSVLDHSVRLNEKDWLSEQQNHYQILKPIISEHQQRAKKREKHPIVDFLFEYYHFKASKLLEWSPGIGYHLSGESAIKFLSKKAFKQSIEGIYVDPKTFPEKRMFGLQWTINLLENTQNRKPSFNCFGLHEWCMVYEENDIRHPSLSLRLGHHHTRKVVEQHSIACSHYDAYRFYSKSAVKFNSNELSRETMAEVEQPGCLHTNMDLYRWTYKFHPWVSSQLLRQTFLLALAIRETDMRASPYCVCELIDLPAIKIETTQGKSEYVALQKQHYEDAKPLRIQLLTELKQLKNFCLIR